MFIRAERTGYCVLHLEVTQEILNFFAAAGHNNYSKCCRLYLQQWFPTRGPWKNFKGSIEILLTSKLIILELGDMQLRIKFILIERLG